MELRRNYLPISEIYVDPSKDGRIRDPENTRLAVKERVSSILHNGQLQPILVEYLNEPINGKKWKLVDGQVRMLSLLALSALVEIGDLTTQQAFDKHGLRRGEIEVTFRENLDPITALMMEFHANEDRDDFTWDEKGKYIRRIHDMLKQREGKEWTAKKTAEAINQSEATVSQYLTLTDETDPAAQSERVQKATTKTAALKQLKIIKERHRRTKAVEAQKVRAAADPTVIKDHEAAARLTVYHGDARSWIKAIPDNSLSWFHWDPPWGGREGKGGAFASHKGIQMDFDYCLTLMEDMIPEIWRVLLDGSWLAMWYTPVNYAWLRYALQGHKFDKSGTCLFCGKHIVKDHAWLSGMYSCRKSPWRFWVNPYPNYWLKTDREADGHEIQRFFTKKTEPFLLAGKNAERMPILLRTNRGNTFDYPGVSGMERRHVNHKPAALLSELLSCISVPGSIGGDAGAGSGSIVEACFQSSRKFLVAELDDEHFKDTLSAAQEGFKQVNWGPESLPAFVRSLIFTE